MSESSQKYATEVLTKAEVNLHLGRGVTEMKSDSVTLDDGTVLAADVTIWAGGLTVHLPSIEPAPELDSHGRVIIEPDLRIAGKNNAYCIGDVSADRKNPLPPCGPVAKQHGIALAQPLGGETAPVRVSFDGSSRSAWLWVQGVALALTVVLALPARRRDLDDDSEDLGAEDPAEVTA